MSILEGTAIGANIMLTAILFIVGTLKGDVRDIKKSLFEHISNYRVHKEK